MRPRNRTDDERLTLEQFPSRADVVYSLPGTTTSVRSNKEYEAELARIAYHQFVPNTRPYREVRSRHRQETPIADLSRRIWRIICLRDLNVYIIASSNQP